MGVYAHLYDTAAGIFGTDKKGVPEVKSTGGYNEF
jgi:hypothetical protein